MKLNLYYSVVALNHINYFLDKFDLFNITKSLFLPQLSLLLLPRRSSLLSSSSSNKIIDCLRNRRRRIISCLDRLCKSIFYSSVRILEVEANADSNLDLGISEEELGFNEELGSAFEFCCYCFWRSDLASASRLSSSRNFWIWKSIS